MRARVATGAIDVICSFHLVRELCLVSDSTSPSRVVALGRGLAGRCPSCGGRGIFAGLNDLVEACPTCRFSFVREEGYWVGAMIVIMALVLIFFGIWTVGGILVTWPDVPWTPLLVGGIVLNLVVPLALYGWSKTIWVGLDLAFNPARAEEFRLDDG